ncbi:MAG: hypothetical protein J0H27_08640 [Xanthomonadales bacterium]|nr:hypothetical protein [Xanthomonadales bacterium]ODU93029.1 MAG: hypothetical protein ABT18_09650 [Rhodanobacter sp. SCN 66-43]OJY83802.1 MAG: hypothetical protein BGP23_14365 [Xanthomonadales bacterium 66-474]
MTTKYALSKWVLSGCMLCASLAAFGAPWASSQHAGKTSDLKAQQKDVDAKLASARTQHDALQSQVTQLEQQNAAQQAQLQQRDAEIAALQQKLQAAGVPASAASSSH